VAYFWRLIQGQNNLKQWGLVFKMYAGEIKGEKFPMEGILLYGPTVDCTDSSFPPAGMLAMKSNNVHFPNVYPEYLSDVNLYLCPSSARQDSVDQKNAQGDDITTQYCSEASTEALDGFDAVGNLAGVISLVDTSYIYHAWLLDKMDDEWAFDTQYGAMTAQYFLMVLANPCYLAGDAAAQFACTDGDLAADSATVSHIVSLGGVEPIGNGGGNTLYRHREGIERFLITVINNPAASAVAQSELPVMWDKMTGGNWTSQFNHVPGGANVLYVDGHVEFIRYPGSHPATKWRSVLWTSAGGVY